MIEILTVLDTIDNYSKYQYLINKYNTDIDIDRIIKTIDKYYSEEISNTIDWSSFSSYFFINNPMIKDEKKILFSSMFSKLETIATTLKSSFLETFLERYHAERIAVKAMEIAEGKPGTGGLLDIQTELTAYEGASEKVNDIKAEANTKSLDELLSTVSSGSGLRWRLEYLNEALGEIRKGDFLLFGGRPDSGKTSMLCSEGGFMAQQLPEDKQFIYFTNEEGGDDVKLRMISSVLGIPLIDLRKDPLTYWTEYGKLLKGNDRIVIVDKYDLSVGDIEWWLENTNPGLIAIDQLRKVKGFYKTQGIERTEKIFNLGREWSKHYAPLLTVGQLDGMAEGIAYPDMSRLYESKTAIQGELDAIINIGVQDGTVPPNRRFLNVCKNKLPTPENPALRNGKFEVLLHKEIARFSS